MNNITVVRNVVDYIETHIDEDLSLDKISNALHYSKFYLIRIFHQETTCTIYKYIKGRRLTLAAQKLVETEKPIIDIAYEAHYNSQQAFTLAFHNLYQCAPKTYRKIGIFYPKQTRIRMISSFKKCARIYNLWGGRFAA